MNTIIQSGIKRPDWICSQTRQDVFLVRDVSPSMNDGTKALDATKACKELLTELALPVNRNGFYVCVVDFSGVAKVTHHLETASSLVKNLSPVVTGILKPGTNISLGLKEVLNNRGFNSPAENQQEDRIRLRPVVLLFSDGGHNMTPEPYSFAEAIKRNADLVTVAFGYDEDADACESMLKRLASSPRHFYRCRSGKNLRNFLAQVGATMVQTLASRQNATQALGALQS
jgi:hypothetical protein